MITFNKTFTRKEHPADEAAWRECLGRNEYRLGAFPDGEGSVLDIGAHIGIFALACLVRGASSICCYEADPDNFRQLEINMKPFSDRVQVHYGAVWRSDVAAEVIPMLREPGNVCGSSVVTGLGDFSVPVVKLDDILRKLESVNLMKLDCEASEYPILFGSTELKRVGRMMVEVHNHAPFADWAVVPGRQYTVHALAEYLLSPEGGDFREVTIARNMSYWPLKNLWALR